MEKELNLFNTKCYSCKDITTLDTPLKANYEFRFDSSRAKCTLCLKVDESCYYKKVTKLYATCGDLYGPIGEGT
jgi:hypothetical protein